MSAGSAFFPGLAPFDLTRGGSFLNFNGSTTIKEESAYVQDSMKFSRATISLGLRADNYDGLATALPLEPRVGVTYQLPGTGTVFRGYYGRFLETPYNENLILSSATGAGGLANISAPAAPLTPGTRNALEVGAQQGLGRWVLVDFGYYWKYTDRGLRLRQHPGHPDRLSHRVGRSRSSTG